MAVVNVDANSGVALPVDTVPGLMHVYVISTYADFGISIYNAPPPYTWHHVVAGDMRTFQVDNFAVWVWNNGPSRIQLLYADLELEGISVHEAAGLVPLDAG